MNNRELVKKLAEKRGMSQADTKRMLDTVTRNFCDHLARGISFTIPDLGTFRTQVREKRRSYNPHYKKEMELPPKRVVDFTPGKYLKDIFKNSD